MAKAAALRVERIALLARAFLEPVWRNWHEAEGKPLLEWLSRGTCGRSSLFLQRALIHADIPAAWRSGSPYGSRPFGYFDGALWHGHAWVETGGWVVDVTADQFGGPPVLIVRRPDPRYRPDATDAATPQAIARRHREVEEIWPQWLDRVASEGSDPPIGLSRGQASR